MKLWMVVYVDLDTDLTNSRVVKAETAEEAEQKIKPFVWHVVSVLEIGEAD